MVVRFYQIKWFDWKATDFSFNNLLKIKNKLETSTNIPKLYNIDNDSELIVEDIFN